MATPTFDFLYAIPVKNGEVVISRMRRAGAQQDTVSISPRKQYINADGEVDKYIPKNSSLQFANVGQISELIAALTKASLDIFGDTPG